jgi:hypothetical protein
MEIEQPVVFCVVPNWNGADLIVQCLKSLENQSYAPRIVVVDNGSGDDSVKLIKQNCPDVVVLEQRKNLGFAGGVNIGIKYAMQRGGYYVALFNNDAVAEKHWIEELLSTASSQKNIGIVTSKLIHIDKGYVDSTGELFYSWGVPGPRGRGEKDNGQYDKPEHVFAASGGASLYSCALFKQIGLFDEDFFAYYEDVDLSFRAQLAGWQVYYQPKAVAYHHINASSRKVRGLHTYHMAKNLPLLIWKNIPISLLPGYLLRFSLLYAVILMGFTKQGEGIYALKGFFMSLVFLPKKLIERRSIQKQRKVSTNYIRSLITPGLPQGTTKLRKFLNLFRISTS